MRSRVDLPQPEGPRMAMKSLSATASSVRSRACVGGPRPTPGKMRETASTTSFSTRPEPLERPREGAAVRPLESDVRSEPDDADHDHAEDHLPGVEEPLAVHDRVPDAALRAHQ